MTQLSVKTLRHYHEVGLLEPNRVDPATGYRYYARGQVPTAQVVRRLRELGMPIADVRAVLASSPTDRNALISGHLERLENQLAATRSAVESLRAILERPVAASRVEHCSVAATPAASRSRIDTPATGAYGRGRTSLREAFVSDFSDADMDASWGRGRT